MRRFSEAHIRDDLGHKIVLLSGPRQAGKTTLSKQLGLGFDNVTFDSGDDRKRLRSKAWNREAELVIFDELHKMRTWKAWIKGVFAPRCPSWAAASRSSAPVSPARATKRAEPGCSAGA